MIAFPATVRECPRACSRTRGNRAGSIPQGAAVLVRIGTTGERALVPVDPDRLAAAERADHARGLVPELLQALDDVGGHAVLELIDVFIMQAARHIGGFLHVAVMIPRPFLVTSDGIMVCSGRLPGAMQLGWPGWTRKPPPRFCSRMPVLLETIAEPKECAIELMNEQTLRSLST